MSMFERLSGDYNRGYTQAIMDLAEIFSPDYIQWDLKIHHKKLTSKMMGKLFRCCLDNREKLRDNWDGFIRYNGKLDDFEFYGCKDE